MKIKKHVLSIIGKKMEQFGFGFKESYSCNDVSYFTRKTGIDEQMIIVQKSKFNDSLMLQFQGRDFIDAGDLVPEEKYRIPRRQRIKTASEFWENANKIIKAHEAHGFTKNTFGVPYADEDDLKAILHEFAEIIELYGIPELERLAAQPKVYPAADLYRRLFDNYKALAAEFENESGLKVGKIVREDTPALFGLINKKILEMENASYDETAEKLLSSAAFLGEEMRARFGGEWVFNDDVKKAYIVNMQSTIAQYSPLVSLMSSWEQTKTIGTVGMEFLDMTKI